MIKAIPLLILGGLLIGAAGCATKEPTPATTTAAPNSPQAQPQAQGQTQAQPQAQPQGQAQAKPQAQGFTPRGSGPPSGYPTTR